MNHDKGAVCLCVADHRPAPLEFEWHHVRPLGDGGEHTLPGVMDRNGVWLCPTAHTNAHEILRLIVRRRGVLPWSEALALWETPVSRYAFALAHEGYRRIVGNEWPA